MCAYKRKNFASAGRDEEEEGKQDEAMSVLRIEGEGRTSHIRKKPIEFQLPC